MDVPFPGEHSDPSSVLPLVVRYTLSTEEMKRLYTTPPFWKWGRQAWLGIGLWVLVILVFGTFTVALWNSYFGVILAIFMYSWLFQAVQTFAGMTTRWPKDMEDSETAAEVCARIDANGFVEDHALRTLALSWRQIDQVRINQDCLFFERKERSPSIVPVRCLPSSIDPVNFVEFLNRIRLQGRGSDRPDGPGQTGARTVSFVGTPQEMACIYRRHMRIPSVARYWRIALAVYYIGASAIAIHFLSPYAGTASFLYGPLAGVILTAITSPVTSARSGAMASMKKTPGMLGPFTVTLSPEGVGVVHDAGRNLTPWPGVLSVDWDKDAICFLFWDYSVIAVPKRCFADAAEMQAFLDTAHDYQAGKTPAAHDNAVWPPAPKPG